MKYGLLLQPHANRRYFEATKNLCQAELVRLMAVCGRTVSPTFEQILGVDLLTFETEALDEASRYALSCHASVVLCVEMLETGDWRPVLSARAPYLFGDLSGVLKYKGKTNEAFTRHLINMALTAGVYFFEPRIALFDPLCGRGTTLFEGINRGFNVYGADSDLHALDEGAQYLKRYLEYHRMKHECASDSRTLSGKRAARVKTFRFAENDAAYRAGDTRECGFVYQDAASAAQALGANRFHAIVFDLPYGVQHAPGGLASFDALLADILPPLFRALKKGGALAFSMNTHTVTLDCARRHLSDAGFAVLTGEVYDHNAHFVEQAILRDEAIGLKP